MHTVRELRELTRRRRTLVRERAQEVNRLHKSLEDTGIKLDCVATDILGVSGRSMLDALLAGERDPQALAGLAKGRLRVKRAALVEAFEGVRFGSQNVLLIGGILRHIDFLDAEIAAFGEAIEAHLAAKREDGTPPFEPAVRLLCSLDGIQARTAEMLLGEFGTDMTRFFPSDKHFTSWAAQCPGNPPIRRETTVRKDAQGPEMARRGAARRRDGRDPRQGRPLRPQVSADQSPLRPQHRDRRDQARDPPRAQDRRAVPTPDRSPRYRAQATRTDHQPPDRSARTARAHRHAPNGNVNVNDTGGGRTLNVFS
jgi:transposase